MARKIEPQKTILSANDRLAQNNRRLFDELGLTTVNVLASPGAGKTSVILAILKSLPRGVSSGVIEGDVASCVDTDRIKSFGFAAVQINTDGGCHLTAAMIDKATASLGVKGPGLLFIENIGNLICPVGFDLGEHCRVVIASVPEGDDKAIKYPGVFATGDVIVLNKIDLLGHVDFEMGRFTAAVRAVNANAPILHMSARTGEGLPAVRDWLLAQRG